MSASKNIMIIGGTGLIGEHISNAIVASRQHFDRIALFGKFQNRKTISALTRHSLTPSQYVSTPSLLQRIPTGCLLLLSLQTKLASDFLATDPSSPPQTSANTLFTKSPFIDSLKSRSVEIIVGDITLPNDIREAFTGFDTVISCVGRQVISAQLELIRIADAHPDVKRFFPSEYGTDVEHNANSATEKPHQAKLKVRAALAAAQNLEYTYVVTGPYANAERGLYLSAAPVATEASGSFDVKRKRAVLLGDPDAKVSLTTMRDVGKLVVAALRHPEEAKNRALLCNSFTASPRAILEEFERQTGGEKWEVANTDLETLKQLEKEAWERQDARAVPLSLRRIWSEGGTIYAEPRHNGLIGMEEGVDSLQSAVEQAIKVQTE